MTPRVDLAPCSLVQTPEGQAGMPGVSHVADNDWFVVVTICALLLWDRPLVYSISRGTKRRGEAG